MQKLSIILDPNHDGKDFDEALKECDVPECGDMSIIVKHGTGLSGNSSVMVTFSVKLPSGQIKKVQAVTTAKLFMAAGDAVKGSVERYQSIKGMN